MAETEHHSKFWKYFFSDGYRIAINIFTSIGIILFIIVMYLTYSRKKESNFKLIFIIMINVMISGILSPLGYLLNWKVENENTKQKELLFGDSDGALCQIQSFILAFFQSSRETFVTFLTFIVFVNYFKSKNLNVDKLVYKVIVQAIGYGIPLIANFTYSLIGAFGESHLFCFTKLDTSGVTSICGTIHFTYIFVLLLLSLFFILYIIIKDLCCKTYDPWTDDDNGDEKQKGCMNSELIKIIFYPIAQIFSMSYIFYYRFRDYFINEVKNSNTVAGTAAVINAISSIIYTLIFIFSNNIFACHKKRLTNEEIENAINKTESMTEIK